MSDAIGYPEPGGERTGGHAGSDASQERALSEARDGTKARHERQTLGLLGQRGVRGITVAELRQWSGWHHGSASSVLSVLHKAGRISRLVQRRGRCHIYVLPEYVVGRETQPQGHAYKTDQLREAFETGWKAHEERYEGDDVDSAYVAWRITRG